MIPAPFDYARPATLDEAFGLMAADPDAKLLAGGQSLIPLMKLRLATPARLIDIGRISDLRGIRELEGGAAIRSLTTYREALDSAVLRERFPLLAEVIETIGDVQVRNRGTIGGGIAHADPASDMPAVVMALGADLVLRSRAGERIVAAEEFFLGPFQTAMEPGEILTEIRLPPVPNGARSAYRQLEQPASGYSLVGVAVLATVSGGRVETLRVGVTGVGDRAYRATAVEQALAGADATPASIDSAAARVTDGIDVASDIHADREYRTEMARVFTRRALQAVLGIRD